MARTTRVPGMSELLMGIDLEGAKVYMQVALSALKEAKAQGGLPKTPSELDVTYWRGKVAADAILAYIAPYDDRLEALTIEAGKQSIFSGLAAAAGPSGHRLMSAVAAVGLGDLLGERYRQALLEPLEPFLLGVAVEHEGPAV